MKPSEHQIAVIRMMAIHGYTLKHQNEFGSSYWLTKKLPKGFIHSVNILKRTFKALMQLSLIRDEKFIRIYKQSTYMPTKYGIKFLTKDEQRYIEVNRLIKQANVNRQRQYTKEMAFGIRAVRVRYTFWEQVARDYTREINQLKKSLKIDMPCLK